jgi:hypothetical protein
MESDGHAALEPSHVSAGLQASPPARQTVPAALRASEGHAALEPVHDSAGSQAPVDMRQVVPLGYSEQVPTEPGMLQASHTPPLQEVLQQTPSTQLPEAHWLAAEQAAPLAFFTVQVPLLQ